MISLEQARAWVAAGRQQGGRYQLAMPRQASSGRAGLHLGVGRGSSVEFHEHREYQPGDDLRHLDWNVSARSDRLVVKLYREEVNPCFDLVVDGSRSMALPGTAKAEAAVTAAALLCTAAAGTGWHHLTWYTAEVCERLTPGALVAEAWCAAAIPEMMLDSPSNPATAMAGRPPRWRARSVRMLISDLLWPGDPLPLLHRLAGGAAAAAVLCIVSRHDMEPPQEGNLRLVDVESGEELPVRLDQEAARRYRNALQAHTGQWRQAARSLGVALVTVLAEELVQHWDLSELVGLGLLRAAY